MSVFHFLEKRSTSEWLLEKRENASQGHGDKRPHKSSRPPMESRPVASSYRPTRHIGKEWIRDLEQLKKLESFVEDEDSRSESR